MKTSVRVLAAACCLVSAPAATMAADAGTITINWTGSTISPSTLAAVAGDTFTVQYGTGSMSASLVFYDGTGSFTGSAGTSCQGSPVAGETSLGTACLLAFPGQSGVFTVVQPGTLQVWDYIMGSGLGVKMGEITIGSPAPSTPTTTTTTTTAATPAPPPPTAQLLRSPTTQNTRQSNRIGCSQVSVPLQLDKVGSYTFIYERSTGQSASARESQVTNATRVTWNTGSTLGKRKLTKASTAPVLVTTEANKRLVVNGLIKKAQAKNLRLRVIHKATDGTLTQDVFTTEAAR